MILYCRYSFWPVVTALFSVNPANSEAVRPFVMAAHWSNTVSVWLHCSLGRRPRAAQRIPMVKMVPLWVLTFFVAVSMSCSAFLPGERSFWKVCVVGEWHVCLPIRVHV